MDRSTLQAKLDAANQRSVSAYLRRQQIQQQAQQVQQAAQQVDQELIALDGAIETLTVLIAEVADGE